MTSKKPQKESGTRAGLHRWLRKNTFEGLGLGVFGATKVSSKSLPSAGELAFLLVLLLGIKLVRYLWQVPTVRQVIRHMKESLDIWANAWIYRDFEPLQFVRWLTKGRVDSNVSCQERITFEGRRCIRAGCRFDCARTHSTPEKIWKSLPRRTQRGPCVRLGVREVVVREGSLGEPGRLVGWSARGLAFTIPGNYCKTLSEDCDGPLPRKLWAHVDMGVLGLPVARVLVSPRKSRSQGKDVLVYGEYHPSKPFVPDSAGCLSNCISTPVCELLLKERQLEEDRTFTKVPIVP